MIFDRTAFERYMGHPYLAKTHEVRLRERHDAISANLWTAEPPGRPQLHHNPAKLAFWTAKLTETRAEQYRRLALSGLYRGDLGTGVRFEEKHLIRSATLPTPILDAVSRLKLPPHPVLVRFTDAQHATASLELGSFRIAPAAQYNDPSLNAAQKDDELTHFSVRGDRHLMFELIGFLPGEDASQARPMPLTPGELFEYMTTSNFFALCLTDQFDGRMFRDFGKDAAIIIRDPAAFLKRIARATSEHFPELRFQAAKVGYYDPYTVERSALKPGFSKNFSFAYQSEFRLLWWPTNPGTGALDAFFLEVGDLRDIADVIYL